MQKRLIQPLVVCPVRTAVTLTINAIPDAPVMEIKQNVRLHIQTLTATATVPTGFSVNGIMLQLQAL
jgi:hypothetical protein